MIDGRRRTASSASSPNSSRLILFFGPFLSAARNKSARSAVMMYHGTECSLAFRFFGLKYPSKISCGKKGWCKSCRRSVGCFAGEGRYLSEYRDSSTLVLYQTHCVVCDEIYSPVDFVGSTT